MGEFLHKYNTDNVHSRAVIVGMINLLNGKIMFENVLSDSSINIVYVPFFYNQGGDERFMQDYFLEWNDCINPKHADGNYDVIPRGVVTLKSKVIDTSKLTHRFVRGTYVKEVNGQLQQFNSYINSLPITMTFSVEIEADTNLDAFKIEQAIMETFYKTQVFSVNFRGFRVPCQVGFAEDYGLERTFEYTYQSNTKIMLNFDLELETYYPVTDPTTERSNSNRMNLGNNAASLQETWSEAYATPRFKFITPTSGEKYFCGGIIPITWSNTGPILRVNLYYRIKGSENWIPIAMNMTNAGYFNWEVPFFDVDGNEITSEPQKAYAVSESGRGSKLRAVINSLGEVDQIIIFNSGLVYKNSDMVSVELYPKPTTLPADYTEPVIQIQTVNSGEIANVNIVSPGSGFVPSLINEIEFKIQDSNSESTYQVFDDEITFTGDTNGTTTITNINPTVNELVNRGLLTGLSINGGGIVINSEIVSINLATNSIEINIPSNLQITGGKIFVSKTVGKIIIQ